MIKLYQGTNSLVALWRRNKILEKKRQERQENATIVLAMVEKIRVLHVFKQHLSEGGATIGEARKVTESLVQHVASTSYVHLDGIDSQVPQALESIDSGEEIK